MSGEQVVDNMDLAQEINELHLEVSLNAVRSRMENPLRGVATHCIDCDELIPKARRKAMTGSTRCRDCQELHEKDGRFMNLPYGDDDAMA